MFSWTEKVSGKISRLRSDSESSHSNESDVVRPEFQVAFRSLRSTRNATNSLDVVACGQSCFLLHFKYLHI